MTKATLVIDDSFFESAYKEFVDSSHYPSYVFFLHDLSISYDSVLAAVESILDITIETAHVFFPKGLPSPFVQHLMPCAARVPVENKETVSTDGTSVLRRSNEAVFHETEFVTQVASEFSAKCAMPVIIGDESAYKKLAGRDHVILIGQEGAKSGVPPAEAPLSLESILSRACSIEAKDVIWFGAELTHLELLEHDQQEREAARRYTKTQEQMYEKIEASEKWEEKMREEHSCFLENRDTKIVEAVSRMCKEYNGGASSEGDHMPDFEDIEGLRLTRSSEVCSLVTGLAYITHRLINDRDLMEKYLGLIKPRPL